MKILKRKQNLSTYLNCSVENLTLQHYSASNYIFYILCNYLHALTEQYNISHITRRMCNK